MMEFKKEKQLNLFQFVDYITENPNLFRGITFKKEARETRTEYCFIDSDDKITTIEIKTPEDIVIMKTTEEITEETIIPKLLNVWTASHLDKDEAIIYNNKSIKEIIEEDTTEEHIEAENKSFYLMTDDGELILIWEDGKILN